MEQFSQLIQVIPLSTGESISLIVDKFSFEPTSEEASQGTLYDCALTLYTTDTISSPFSKGTIKGTVLLNNGDVAIGSSDYPAHIKIDPLLNVTRITLSCKQPNSPI